jgi:Integrase core domain
MYETKNIKVGDNKIEAAFRAINEMSSENMIEEKREIARKIHYSTEYVHPGKKVIGLLMREQGMKIDIETKKNIQHMVRSCDLCQKNKSTNSILHGLFKTTEVPDYPGEYLSIDAMGPVNDLKSMQYITVIVDRSTKYVWTFIGESAPCSEHIIRMLESIFYENNFLPKMILSDNAKAFTSKKISE